LNTNLLQWCRRQETVRHPHREGRGDGSDPGTAAAGSHPEDRPAYFVAGICRKNASIQVSNSTNSRQSTSSTAKSSALQRPIRISPATAGRVVAPTTRCNSPNDIFRAIDTRWGIEYPATNNAVVNGGFVAASVWFGNGDFQKTLQLATHAADFAELYRVLLNLGCHGPVSAPRVSPTVPMPKSFRRHEL
jgi:hypothetical protein